ncbi:MAG: hypothetical protein ACRDB3_22465 [Citrobacter telavivensis]
MKPLYLVRTLIILFFLSGSGSLFAGMNPDGTITFQSGQIQYSSNFSWGQSLPNFSGFGFTESPSSYTSLNPVTTLTNTYNNTTIASNYVNTFMQHIQPLCGGSAVISGTSVTFTVDPASCYIWNSQGYVRIFRVTTPGGWANCKSTAVAPWIRRQVISSINGIIYRAEVEVNASRTYDTDGALTSAITNEVTIAGGSSMTATTYRRVLDYESTIDITETPMGYRSGTASAMMMSCAAQEYFILGGNLISTNGYIRFSSGLSTDHLNVISSTLPNYTPQQVNNRVISPALDVIPSATINVGSIAGFTYPEWHEYPFQITAVSNVEYNVGASIDFPVLVRWTCTPPTGNVNFEIRSPSGTNLCNGQETSHPAVTTPLDVRAAWRPSSASATGTWSAAATVEYILP